MDLQTLDITQEEAVERLAEYEAQLAEERTAEDRAILSGYRAAARNLPIISLPRTVAAGGFHPNGLPRIAVARADIRECFCWWDGNDLLFSDEADWRVNFGALVNRRSVRVPLAVEELPEQRDHRSAWQAGSAVVPPIPPRHRPKKHRLRGFHILWEVEAWTRQPPRDPALLRHLRGDMWTVHAVWDLSDLERLVLTQRVAVR